MRGELVRDHASARRPSVLAAACVALVALACACVIAMPAHAAAAHVYDEAGILTADEISQLEAQADEVEQTRGFSVNIVTVEDYKAISTVSVFDAAVAKYKELSLDGSDGSGIVLMLSMKERDYSVAVNGDRGNYAFNREGRALLTGFFLDDFADNEWYKGFSDYIKWCGVYVAAADAGHPFSDDNPPEDATDLLLEIAMGIGGSLVAAAVLTALVMAALMRRMRSVEPASNASAYVSGQLQLDDRRDVFTHTTTVREVVVEKSSGGGGGGGSVSSSSGGFSGTSGKF